MWLNGAAALTEGAGRKRPAIVVVQDDGHVVFIGGGKGCQLLGNLGIGTALADERCEVSVPFEGIAEVLLEGDELISPHTADAGSAGELVLVAEDAELAGAAAEPHLIARVGTDAILLEKVPDLLFAPVADGAHPVDVAPTVASVPKVGPVGLEDGISGPLFAFLAAFSGEDEGAYAFEPFVVSEGCCADVYLKVGAAPARAKVRGRLGELPSRGRSPTGASDCTRRPVGAFEADGGRQAVVAEHLTQEPAVLPLEEDRDAQRLTNLTAVVWRHFPVEKGRAAAVDLLMPELDLLFGDAVLQEEKEARGAVLPSGEADDIFVVTVQVNIHLTVSFGERGESLRTELFLPVGSACIRCPGYCGR